MKRIYGKRLTIEHVRQYVKAFGEGATLISNEYNTIDKKLTFKCECGRTFKTSFYKFEKENKNRCNQCNGITYWYYENTKELFLSHNLDPLFNRFEGRIGAKVKLPAINKSGYKVCISIDNLKAGQNTYVFSKSNPYTIENIKTYLRNYAKDYTLLSTNYANSQTKLKWKCGKGHVFEMVWGDFKSGKRCSKCSGKYRRTNDEFINEVYELVGNEYAFLGEFKSVDSKIKVVHRKCNHAYEVTPYKFINAGQRCPRCNESRGERSISDFLLLNDIDFEREYSFDDCKLELPLRFDFAIFDSNNLKMLIEFDGRQHFEAEDFYGGEEELKIVKKRDRIKNDYTKNKNIKLLRIPYTEYDNIEEILTTHLL